MTDKKSIFPPTSMAHEKPNFPSLSPELRLAEDARFSEATRDSFFPTTSMGTDTTITLGTKTKTAANEAAAQKEQVAGNAATSPSAAIEAPQVSSKEEMQPKVFCKSCRAPRGTTEAGTTDEPLRNFGEMAILQSAPKDSKPCSALHSMAISGSLVLKGATDLAEFKLPKLGAIRFSVGGVLARTSWMALFFPNKLGDGTLASMEDIQQAGAIESRVKFNFYTDKDGKEFVSGYHDGSGTSGYGEPVQSVEATEDKNSTSKSYIADLGDGTIITWYPEESDKTPLSTPLPRSKRIDPSTILVRPIDSEAITTTTYPEEEIIELIVTFPADSGIEPLYLVFSKPPVKLLEVDLYGNFKNRPRNGTHADHMPSQAALREYLKKTFGENYFLDSDVDKMMNDVATVIIPARIHQKFSETYGRRNTRNDRFQIEKDAADLRVAVENNFNAIRPYLKQEGLSDDELDAAKDEMHKLNVEKGWYK